MFVYHEFDKARITNHNFIHCNVHVPVRKYIGKYM